MLVTAKIDHRDDGYYIAYGIDGDYGSYHFTDSRYNICVLVLKDKALALSVLERYK